MTLSPCCLTVTAHENNQLKNDIKSEHSKVKLLEYELEFLRTVNESNKKLIIDLMDQKHSHLVQENNAQQTTNEPELWIYPKRYAKSNKQPHHNIAPVTVQNKFNSLAYVNNGPEEHENSKAESTVLHAEPEKQTDQDTMRIDSVPTCKSQIKKQDRYMVTENHVEKFVPIVPGKSTYKESIGKGRNIFVISDSMLRRIRKKEFGDCINNGTAWIKCFDGATPKQMNHFTIPFLIEDHPNTVVIHSGTNVLKPIHGVEEQSCEGIAKDIVNIGKNCKQHGVEHVVISSIIIRRASMHIEKRRREVNQFVKSMCIDENFIFVDNEAITLRDIDDYGVHLEESGSRIVANNILKALNSLPIHSCLR